MDQWHRFCVTVYQAAHIERKKNFIDYLIDYPFGFHHVCSSPSDNDNRNDDGSDLI
jgi:hypothetical protein